MESIPFYSRFVEFRLSLPNDVIKEVVLLLYSERPIFFGFGTIDVVFYISLRWPPFTPVSAPLFIECLILRLLSSSSSSITPQQSSESSPSICITTFLFIPSLEGPVFVLGLPL